MDEAKLSRLEAKFNTWFDAGWRIYHVTRNSGDLEPLKKGELSFEEFKKIKNNEYFLCSPTNMSYPLCKDEIEIEYTEMLAEEFGDERNVARNIINNISQIGTRAEQYEFYKKYLSKF